MNKVLLWTMNVIIFPVLKASKSFFYSALKASTSFFYSALKACASIFLFLLWRQVPVVCLILLRIYVEEERCHWCQCKLCWNQEKLNFEHKFSHLTPTNQTDKLIRKQEESNNNTWYKLLAQITSIVTGTRVPLTVWQEVAIPQDWFMSAPRPRDGQEI